MAGRRMIRDIWWRSRCVQEGDSIVHSQNKLSWWYEKRGVVCRGAAFRAARTLRRLETELARGGCVSWLRECFSLRVGASSFLACWQGLICICFTSLRFVSLVVLDFKSAILEGERERESSAWAVVIRWLVRRSLAFTEIAVDIDYRFLLAKIRFVQSTVIFIISDTIF